MKHTHEPHKRKYYEIRHLIFRNVFVLINIIIFTVVAFLFFFGDTKEGIFLGIIIVINTIIGIVQDIHAWLMLERLQLLTAPRAIRINEDGTEELVLSEEIKKDDQIKLKLGDQIPCDGVLVFAHSLEVNEALITGESKSFPKGEGEEVSAGSIVSSGSGIMRVNVIFYESRIFQMTEGIKRYSVNVSPIQHSVNMVVRYAGYTLLAVIAFVIVRGVIVSDPSILVVKNIGALASMLVPQGLVIAMTLLFAYGSIHLFRRHVLLQEVNAAEKLGRIKNLCMDKTGTLTENTLVVEEMRISPGVSSEEARELMATYIDKSGDSSQTVFSIKKFLGQTFPGEVSDALSFSSSRRYGGILVKGKDFDTAVLVGAPEVFIPHLSDDQERQWLQEVLDTYSRMGKRVICIVRSRGTDLPRNLSSIKLSTVAVFVLHNALREGIHDAINFFQDRGVRIYILSGDSPETVRAVAVAAGIKNTEALITSAEMESWNTTDFREKVKNYTIFARIKPEQKEKIIEALKEDGFTAMVGDGANDALAIKKADLGIAVFDGAPATRQLASVVLTNNSFAELPGGVKLADNIIRNSEIFSSIFFNQTFVGFFFFVIVSIFGYAYPLTPLNVTLINYFTIGIPGLLISYWVIHPQGKILPIGTQQFLKRVLPFPLASSIMQSFGVAAVFALSLNHLKDTEPNTSVVLAFIALGFIFFLAAPSVYSGFATKMRETQFFVLAVFELSLLFFGFKASFLTTFFDVSNPSGIGIIKILPIAFVCAYIQYEIAKRFFKKETSIKMHNTAPFDK